MIKLIYPKFWAKSGIISTLLIPFSWAYRALGFCRKYYVKPHRFSQITICVGNMSVGGTGKTQIVMWLANELKQKGVKFLIVTKGYGSKLQTFKLVEKTDKAEDVGDESILLSDVGPVLASKKISYAIDIIEKINPEVIIFDDGLQNPGFVKDLSLLAIDSERAIGNGRIFPAGPLRESPKSALNKSDIIIMIGSKSCSDFSLVNKISATGKPFVKAKITIIDKSEFTRKPLAKKYYAFTAIGDPERFYSLLEESGIEVLAKKSFPDHHLYSEGEIENLKKEANNIDSSLITTKKDYVKIKNHDQIIPVDVKLCFENEENLVELIYAKIKTRN